MLGSWLVGVFLRFETNGIATMSRLAGASKIANEQLLRQQGLIDANAMALNRYKAKIEETRIAQLRMVSMLSGAGALALGATAVASINQAAQLQLAMTGIYSATGATGRQRDALRNMVLHVSGYTAQDALTIAQEAFMAASSGLNRPGRLESAFPEIAKAADVLWMATKGTPKAVNPVDAAMQMVKFSHLFGAYQGAPLHNMLDFLTRMMLVQPDSLNKAITQAKYFVPTAIGAGVDLSHLPTSDLAMQLVTMGQTGLMQGRGGTGLARYIEYMMRAPMMTAHLSKNMRASMADLGLFDASGRNRFLDAHGNFELGQSLDYLGKVFDEWSKQGQRSRFIRDVYGSFLAQGGRYVETVTLPQVRAQQSANATAMSRIAPPGMAVDRLWTTYMKDLIPTWNYFATNFKNIWTYVFTPVLPEITTDLRTLGRAFSDFGDYLSKHPDTAKIIARGIMGSAAVLGAFSVFTGVSAVLRWTGVFTAMRSVWGITTTVARVLGPGVGLVGRLSGVFSAVSRLLGPFSIFIAALGVLYDDVVEFKKFMAEGGPNLWDTFREALGPLGTLLPRDLPHGKPAAGGSHPVVHVSVNLPAGSDASQARRIAQLIQKEIGALGSSPSWHIPTGGYNAVPSTG